MSTLRERVIEKLNSRRENLLNGNINCIPLPFKNFRSDLPGIEQGKYYLCTAATKTGKTQIASYLLYNAILYAYMHPEQLAIKVFYIPLEETQEEVMNRFISYLLYELSDKDIHISPVDLLSTNNDKPLDASILELLKSDEYNDILKFFEEHIYFSEQTFPTGIYLECEKYAKDNGTIFRKKVKYKNDFGEIEESELGFDHYESNNPKEYRIIFLDHISLIGQEKGKSLYEAIGDMSRKFVKLRNNYGFTPFVIQQQQKFEGIDAFKMDKLEPSISTLSDNKQTANDVNVCLSLFSPYKYNLHDYKGYNIDIWKDNIRFFQVLLNRGGESNGLLPLYFDGAVSFFSPICGPNDENSIKKWYNFLNKVRSKK